MGPIAGLDVGVWLVGRDALCRESVDIDSVDEKYFWGRFDDMGETK